MTDLGNSLGEKRNDLGPIAEIPNEFVREKKEPERIIWQGVCFSKDKRPLRIHATRK